MSEITREKRPRPVRRLWAAGFAAAALAAGTAAALVLAPTAPDRPAPAPAAAVPVQPIVLVNASQLLDRASLAAAAAPELKPRPGQYLYFESRSRQRGTGAEGLSSGSAHRHVWLPAFGGDAPGYLRNEGEDGRWLCDGLPAEGIDKKIPPKADLADPPQGCAPTRPVYRADLPTTAKAMRAWLYANSRGGNPPDVQAFHTVGDTIRETVVRRESLAALFRAAGTIPGTKLYRNVEDSAGRPGIAVGQTFRGLRQELIFDPKTFRYLGERTVVDFDTSFRPKGGKEPGAGKVDPEFRRTVEEGQVIYSSAQVRAAVTGGPGILP